MASPSRRDPLDGLSWAEAEATIAQALASGPPSEREAKIERLAREGASEGERAAARRALQRIRAGRNRG